MCKAAVIISGTRKRRQQGVRMTEVTKPDTPVNIPEADLLEQQMPWQEAPEVSLTSAAESTPPVTERTADEGDLLEQAQLAVPDPDDDDHPYGARN